jgi:hypothetical protein
MIIALPVLFALMFVGVQAALLHHAKTVAIAAATSGTRAAAAHYGTAADGQAAVDSYLVDVGAGAFESVSGSVTRTEIEVTATIVGRSLSVVPGWSPEIRQSATAPVERPSAPIGGAP